MLNKYPDFWKIILGGGTFGAFLAYLVIALVCAMICFLIGVAKRDVASQASPVKWSTKYLLAANAARLLANFLAIPVLIRLTYEYVDMKWMVALSAVYGIVVDQLALALKNAGVLIFAKLTDKVRDKVTQEDHIITQKPNQ